jgi:hypothetical protein
VKPPAINDSLGKEGIVSEQGHTVDGGAGFGGENQGHAVT